MNRITRRGLLASFCLLAVTLSAFGEEPAVRYRVATVKFPAAPITNGTNNLGFAVGAATLNGIEHGFICDTQGLFGPPAIYWVDDLIQKPEGWTSSVCTGINDSGLVVGVFKRLSPGGVEKAGFIFNIVDVLAGTGSWEFSPNPWGAAETCGRRVNNSGVVLGYYTDDLTSIQYGYLYDTNTGALDLLRNPATAQPIALSGITLEFNDLNQVVGAEMPSYTIFRLSPGILHEEIPLTLAANRWGINDAGVFASTLRFTSNGKTHYQAYEYSNQATTVAPTGTYGVDINNSGDVLVQQATGTTGPSVNQDGYGLFSVAPFVTREKNAGDLEFWNKAKSQSPVSAVFLTDRDDTGFGQIFGWHTITTTTVIGKGKNQTTTTTHDSRLFILTPESP